MNKIIVVTITAFYIAFSNVAYSAQPWEVNDDFSVDCSVATFDEWVPNYGKLETFELTPSPTMRAVMQHFSWKSWWDRQWFSGNQDSTFEIEAEFVDEGNLDTFLMYNNRAPNSYYYWRTNMKNGYIDTQFRDGRDRNFAVGTSYAHGLTHGKTYWTYMQGEGHLNYAPYQQTYGWMNRGRRMPEFEWNSTWSSYGCSGAYGNGFVAHLSHKVPFCRSYTFDKSIRRTISC